jgi:pre-mRNA-processing factor 6
MAKALKECPNSGFLLSENIITAPRVEQKSKSADAIKKCPDDPRVIAAVAALFAGERKNDKARKWFERATAVDLDNGDSWAKLYAFELDAGTKETQENVKHRCVAAEPKHGELWCQVAKATCNRGKPISEVLDIVAAKVLDKMQQLN